MQEEVDDFEQIDWPLPDVIAHLQSWADTYARDSRFYADKSLFGHAATSAGKSEGLMIAVKALQHWTPPSS